MLCSYKNLLGEPKKGVHSYRIFNIAIVDVLLTIIGAYLISWSFQLNFWMILIILFLLGIILHHLFCVNTTIDKLIFG
jgi:fatty acid desaturase